MSNVVYVDSIPVVVKKSNKAKRARITISHANGVQLIIPNKLSQKRALSFLDDKKLWIANNYAKMNLSQNKDAESIPIFGVEHKLVHSDQKIEKLLRIEAGVIHFSRALKVSDFAFVLSSYLKALVIDDFKNLTAKYAGTLGVPFGKISVKDTKGQWGSCSKSGNLSYSWRLVFAPNFVVEYLVVHEVCHLVVRNHSMRFWNLVGQLYPQYKDAKKWLRLNGRNVQGFDLQKTILHVFCKN